MSSHLIWKCSEFGGRSRGGVFGGYLVKAFYALLSLGVCAVVVTGNLVWLERRDPGLAHLGNRVLSKLTVGVCLGLVLSSAVYFVCNRLLPPSLAQRAEIEFRIFISAWVCCIAVVFVRGSARAWARVLCVAAALGFVGVVLSDAALRRAQIEAAFSHRWRASLRGVPPRGPRAG